MKIPENKTVEEWQLEEFAKKVMEYLNRGNKNEKDEKKK